MTITTKLSTRALLNIVSRIAFSAAFFLLNVAAVNELDPERYGRSQFIVWIVYVSWLVGNLGLPSVLIRYGPLFPLRSILSSVTAIFPSGWLVATVIVFGAGMMAMFGREGPMMTVMLTGLGLSMLITSVLEGSFLNRVNAVSSVIAAAATGALCLPLIRMFGVDGYYAAIAVYFYSYSAASLPAIVRTVREQRTRTAPADIASAGMLRYALAMWLIGIVSAFVWQRLEIVFLQTFLTPRDIAFFSVGFLCASVPVQFFGILVSGLVPYFSLHASRGHAGQLPHVYSVNVTAIGTAAIFVAVFFSVYADRILPAVFGEVYRESVTAAVLLMAAMPLAAIGAVGSAVLKGIGKPNTLLVSNVTGLAAAVPLYYWAITSYHLEAMLVIRIGILFLVVGIEYAALKRAVRYRMPFLPLFFAAAVASVIVFGSTFVQFGESLPAVAGSAVCAFAVFAAAVIVLRIVTVEDVRRYFQIENTAA